VAAARLNLDERLVQIQMAVDRRQGEEFVQLVGPVLEMAPPDLARTMRVALASRLRAQMAGESMPPIPVDVPRDVRVPDPVAEAPTSMLELPAVLTEVTP